MKSNYDVYLNRKIGILSDISWLEKLIDGLKTLEEDEFSYEQFVTKSNSECGTVCCAFGWMPKFVPESGVKWKVSAVSKGKSAKYVATVNKDPECVFKAISIYNPLYINFMFYGLGMNLNNKSILARHIIIAHSLFLEETKLSDLNLSQFNEKFGSGLHANLNQVINRIEFIIKHLKTRN